MQRNYKPKVDYARIINSAAEIGSGYSERKNFSEFVSVTTQIDREMINFLASEFDLNTSEKNGILREYRLRNRQLSGELYKELVDLNKKKQIANKKTMFSRETYDGIENLDATLEKKACFVAGLFTEQLTNSTSSSIFAKAGTAGICPFLVDAAVKPLVKELKKRAIIKDYVSCETRIENEISSQIAELATAEYTGYTSSQERFTRTIDWFLIGEREYSALIDISAYSTTKAGFKLDEKFELSIDHGKEEISLILPYPRILSHEVRTELTNVDDGSWFVELDKDDFNYARATVSNTLRERAINSDLGSDATQNAKNVLKVLFSPIATSMPYPYSVTVQFGNSPKETLIDYSGTSLESYISL